MISAIALLLWTGEALMARKRKQRNRTAARTQVTPPPLPNRFPWYWPFLLGSLLAGMTVFLVMYETATEAPIPIPVVANKAEFPSLGKFTEMPAEAMANVDIALLNLRCAEGLSGAEKLDIRSCLRKLDQWAQRVKFETDRHLYRVRDPRFATHYKNSEAYYRASMMLQVLQEDLGVHYNRERIRDVDFTRSQDLFIHGMIGNENGGTCVSMPALYTAIGRRLGYPIKLVLAREHVFCRWDDAKDRFNIEGSGEGFSSFEDEYYKNWPKPIEDADVKSGRYLKSLTPREELAVFLAARGHCLEDNGSSNDAYVAYALANQLAPQNPEYGGFLSLAVAKRHDARMIALAASNEHPRQIEAINEHYERQILGQPAPRFGIHTGTGTHQVARPPVPFSIDGNDAPRGPVSFPPTFLPPSD